MLGNFMSRTYALTTRVAQSFAKFDRSRTHANGISPTTQSEPSATSITGRPPLHPPSPSTWPTDQKPSTSSTDRSTRPQKRRPEVSPSTLLPLSIRPTLAITPTSTVQATSITSKTWSLEQQRWMLVSLWFPLLTDPCPKPNSMSFFAGRSELATSLSSWTRWILSKKPIWLTSSSFNSRSSSKSMTTILKNQLLLEVRPSATFRIPTLRLEKRVLRLFFMPWTLKSKYRVDPLTSHS